MLNVSIEQKHDILGEIFLLISEQEQLLRGINTVEDQRDYAARAARINELLDEIV